ncbi:TPA: tail fiber protein [Salmonella enterica]
MGKLTELEQWDEDIYQIETSDPVLGGPEGLSNRPQKQLANRTQWLKKQLEDANNALAEHEKSRNHPDATLTDKGFVKLYSGVTSMDETMAATPKAVKIAMDNANERLAKARNLADLQSVPLALANLTLADVKKYVESTNTGVSKLPQFRPSSEDDLTSLPAGYMALVKNSTPGGPLPDENWHYLEVAGRLDNPSNNPNRKGAVIRLTQISTPEISWTGVKFDDGTTTTAKFKWSRDFNTLNKPTPEDVGLAATKKAIDDTQTGLAAQGVMWVTSADDLSNLPSGAHRFACNKAPATVLPAAGYFFLEVLAKRDVANGSCILATSDTGNVWIGLRYTAPTDTAFTWIQLNQNVENLGLKETLNPTKRVSIGNIGTGAFDGNIPCINIGGSDSGFIGSADGVIDIYANNQRVGRFSQGTFELLRLLVQRDADNAVGADTNFNTMLNTYDATGNLRWAWGPYKGGWDVHSYDQNGAWRNNPLHIDYRTSEVSVSCNFHVAGATLATDGNIYGTRWNANGAWLWDTIAEQLAIRDNNINARATKSTASLAVNGWFRDASTGWLIQWGLVPFSSLGTYTVNLPTPFPHQGFMAIGTGYEAVDWGNDAVSGSVKLLNRSQLSVTLDNNYPTAWFAIGY